MEPELVCIDGSGKANGLLSAKQIAGLKRVEQSDSLCGPLEANGKH